VSVRDAIRESARCARNIELGGSIDFWATRLDRRISELDTERAVLAAKLSELRKMKAIAAENPESDGMNPEPSDYWDEP